MSRLIIALYDRFNIAHQSVAALMEKGFCQDDISLVALQTACDSTWSIRSSKSRFYQSEPYAITLPGIGPVFVSGFLASDLCILETGHPSLVRVLEKRLIPKIDTQAYAEGVRRRGTLVLVRAERTNSNKALSILDHYCPVDMQALEDQWRQMGWTGFDDTARPVQNDPSSWPGCITSSPGDTLLFDGVLKNWPQTIVGRKTATNHLLNWPACITSLPGDGRVQDGDSTNWPQSIAGRKAIP